MARVKQVVFSVAQKARMAKRANAAKGVPPVQQVRVAVNATANAAAAGSASAAARKAALPRKRRPAGALVEREIRDQQRRTDFCIRRGPFKRIVQDITQAFGGDFRWSKDALEALQEAAEAYAIGLFEKAKMCALHAKRVTVNPKDIYLTRALSEVPRLIGGQVPNLYLTNGSAANPNGIYASNASAAAIKNALLEAHASKNAKNAKNAVSTGAIIKASAKAPGKASAKAMVRDIMDKAAKAAKAASASGGGGSASAGGGAGPGVGEYRDDADSDSDSEDPDSSPWPSTSSVDTSSGSESDDDDNNPALMGEGHVAPGAFGSTHRKPHPVRQVPVAAAADKAAAVAKAAADKAAAVAKAAADKAAADKAAAEEAAAEEAAAKVADDAALAQEVYKAEQKRQKRLEDLLAWSVKK